MKCTFYHLTAKSCVMKNIIIALINVDRISWTLYGWSRTYINTVHSYTCRWYITDAVFNGARNMILVPYKETQCISPDAEKGEEPDWSPTTMPLRKHSLRPQTKISLAANYHSNYRTATTSANRESWNPQHRTNLSYFPISSMNTFIMDRKWSNLTFSMQYNTGKIGYVP